MSQNTGCGGDGKGINRVEQKSGQQDYKGGFSNIKGGAENALGFTQRDDDVGCTCISRALFADVKAPELRQNVGGIDASQSVSQQGT